MSKCRLTESWPSVITTVADCSWLPEQHKRKLVADRIDEVITDYYGSWIYSINLYSAYM